MSSPDFPNVFIKTVGSLEVCIIKIQPTININIKLINPRNVLSGSVFRFVGWQPRFKSKLFLIQKSLESRLAGGKSWWKRFHFKGCLAWPGLVEYFGLISSCLIVSSSYDAETEGWKEQKVFSFWQSFMALIDLNLCAI